MERDPLADEETRAAAAEAARIGGSAGRAEDPVEQAGGGEAEGFEQSEQDLVDAAEGRTTGHDAGRDAFPPEAESDRSGAEYGDADHEHSSEN